MIDTDPAELLIERSDMRQIAAFAAMILDDPDADEAQRDKADEIYQQAHFSLMYEDQPRPVRLVPITFGWPGTHTELLEEFLLDLGSEVVAENPAYVVMARQMAEMTDREGYSTQARLEAYDSLNYILGLIRAAADDEEVDNGDD